MKGKYSFTHLYSQVITYAEHTYNPELCYTIVNKARYISFGIYSQDFHSRNGYKKFVLFHGYIGLESDKDFNVKPIPKKNTINLQHRLYKLSDSGNVEQNRCALSIIGFMGEHEASVRNLN
jgi:hypothetical protein